MCCPREDALLPHLFDASNYRKYSRPVTNMHDTVDVRIGLEVLKIVDVVSVSSALAAPDTKQVMQVLLAFALKTCTGRPIKLPEPLPSRRRYSIYIYIDYPPP